jgi:ribA/ribD-fused uncharacterized protein
MLTSQLNSDPAKLIDWFDDFGTPDNQFRFLSNFYVGAPFQVYGIWHGEDEYMTGEHAFQAAKARGPNEARQIGTSPSPGHAKLLGRQCDLRPDWEAVKFDVMTDVLLAKFASGRDEAGLLLATDNARLVEGTFWNDRIWGVDLQTQSTDAPHHPRAHPGQNWLGRLLMARRAELRA